METRRKTRRKERRWTSERVPHNTHQENERARGIVLGQLGDSGRESDDDVTGGCNSPRIKQERSGTRGRRRKNTQAGTPRSGCSKCVRGSHNAFRRAVLRIRRTAGTRSNTSETFGIVSSTRTVNPEIGVKLTAVSILLDNETHKLLEDGLGASDDGNAAQRVDVDVDKESSNRPTSSWAARGCVGMCRPADTSELRRLESVSDVRVCPRRDATIEIPVLLPLLPFLLLCANTFRPRHPIWSNRTSRPATSLPVFERKLPCGREIEHSQTKNVRTNRTRGERTDASKLHKSVNTRNKKDGSGMGWGG
ncbi:hypothetical protein BDW22DRAFT_1343106 [Trametopsis cervina]|nr:hypothetical protein BDW22DRAFT_1343106 [Trametopsis cervina]